LSEKSCKILRGVLTTTLQQKSKTMKKPNKSFSEQYPYLAYWIEDWGEMETTNG
jgi:hypothetical protein